jgi:TolB protein
MDAEGGNQRRLTFEGKYADSPAWSPKGDKIAFQMMGENGSFDIYTIAPDGSKLTKVTNMPGNNEYPTWAPDGSLIAFVNTVGGRSDLFVVKHDGSRARGVTSSGDVRMPDWSDF